jgi:hypothetical protein
MMMTAFWDIEPYCLVEVDRRFTGACASIIRTTGKRRGLLIALMMEAARTPETSDFFNETTWRCIREGCYHCQSSFLLLLLLFLLLFFFPYFHIAIFLFLSLSLSLSFFLSFKKAACYF